MPFNAHSFFIIALLCPPLAATATTVQRCEAANGHITFTTLSCANDDNPSQQEIRTYKPGSIVALMPEAGTRATATTGKQPTVVGQAQDSCGNLITARERRDAILHKRIVAGMSQQDVESALGKPDKVSVRNSATTYRYAEQKGRSAQVEFDERGCTKGKSKSRTAKSPR